MPVPYHVRDAQVFKRDPVVARNQAVAELVQEVLPSVTDPFVLALQRHNRLATVRSTLLAARESPLQRAQPALLVPIPAWVCGRFAIAGGDQAGKTDIDSDRLSSRRTRLGFHLAGKTGIPAAGFADNPDGLDPPVE